jgi:aspartate dehydrogenase
MTTASTTLKLGIGGLGAIGLAVAKRIDAGDVPGISLAAVAVRDADRARKTLAAFRSNPRLTTLAGLAGAADVVLECLPSAQFAAIAEPAIRNGRILMPLSVGALLNHMPLIDLARETGAKIIVPTGALLGLDAVRAAAEGQITSARIITRKPPAGLAGAPYLVEHNIPVEGLTEALRVFAGTAREAAAGFPANVNVVAALSFAGIGPDRTMIEIWADPAATRNCHSIDVDSDSARFSMTIENIPSENPRTGRITALSVLAALEKIHAPLRVGT